MAAGDIVGDDLDTILDQYGAQSSTLGLLTEYLDGEKDSALNLNNLKKQTKRGSVNLLLASEFQLSPFVSFGGNLTHGKSIL